jgi:hypothetical protein
VVEWTQLCAFGKKKVLDVIISLAISKLLMNCRGSISKVMGDEKLGISASYDATMILWDLGKRQTTQKLLGPHK